MVFFLGFLDIILLILMILDFFDIEIFIVLLTKIPQLSFPNLNAINHNKT